jgi:hypothetical protein
VRFAALDPQRQYRHSPQVTAVQALGLGVRFCSKPLEVLRQRSHHLILFQRRGHLKKADIQIGD